MDSKAKIFSYRGGMYLLLALLTISLIGGFIIYRFSLLSHQNIVNLLDESIFFGIIGVVYTLMAVP